MCNLQGACREMMYEAPSIPVLPAGHIPNPAHDAQVHYDPRHQRRHHHP